MYVWFGLRSRKHTADFLRELHTLVKVHGLNPELPEIAELVQNAKEHARDPFAQVTLSKLNPWRHVNYIDGTVVIEDRSQGHVLEPWSLARHHVGILDDALDQVIADSDGVHLWRSDQRLVTIKAGTIDPTRRGDHGKRYKIACEVIQQFTGIELDWAEHVRKTAKIMVKKSDGSWSYVSEAQVWVAS